MPLHPSRGHHCWILCLGLPPQQFVEELLKDAAEGGAGEIVHHGVEHAVQVGEAHRGVERQVGFPEVAALVVPCLEDPHSDAGHGAGQEANDEDQRHGEHELHGPLDLPAGVHHVPVLQLPRDADRAEGHDARGQGELDHVEGVVPGGQRAVAHADVEALALRAVVAVEEVLVGEQVARGEDDQPPQGQGHPQGVVQPQPVDAVQRVDNLEVSVHSHRREEEDPCGAVGCQQEQQDPTGHVAIQPVLPRR